MNRKEFKKALRELKITQKQFATKVGYSYSTVKGWEEVPKWAIIILHQNKILKNIQNSNSLNTVLNDLKALQEEVQNLDF